MRGIPAKPRSHEEFLRWLRSYKSSDAISELNWVVSPPALDFNRRRLVAPSPPYEEINLLHLVGRTKAGRYAMGPDGRTVGYRYPEIKALFEGPAPTP